MHDITCSSKDADSRKDVQCNAKNNNISSFLLFFYVQYPVLLQYKLHFRV